MSQPEEAKETEKEASSLVGLIVSPFVWGGGLLGDGLKAVYVTGVTLYTE